MIGHILRNVDVLVGNEEDLQKELGIAGPEMAAESKLDPSAFLGMRFVSNISAHSSSGMVSVGIRLIFPAQLMRMLTLPKR